jgi:hypothetical protein
MDSPIWGMITSVGIFSFRGISSWNSTLQQTPDYIAVVPGQSCANLLKRDGVVMEIKGTTSTQNMR